MFFGALKNLSNLIVVIAYVYDSIGSVSSETAFVVKENTWINHLDHER